MGWWVWITRTGSERPAPERRARSSGRGTWRGGPCAPGVARTLKDADWTDLERTLGRTAVRKELGFVRKRLRDFAPRAPAPPSLRRYVEEALRR
jgi:hypothetical protein